MNPTHTSPTPANNCETEILRQAKLREDRKLERGKTLQKTALKIRLLFFDRLVRQVSRVIEDLRRVKEQLESAREETYSHANDLRNSRRSAWLVRWAVFVAASADIFFVLPNIGWALAARVAGGEEPTLWEKIAVFATLEIAIMVLLLTVKSLSDTRSHLEARNNVKAGDTARFQAANWRLWGARIARATYIVLITFAFGLNILAEVGKLDYGQKIWEVMRNSVATQGVFEMGPEAPMKVPAQSEENVSTLSRIPITAGVSVLILALHVIVIFLPPGKLHDRSIGELTEAELKNLELMLTKKSDNLLLRMNGKLESAADDKKNEEIMRRIPEKVLTAKKELMKPSARDSGRSISQNGSELQGTACQTGSNGAAKTTESSVVEELRR